MTPPADPPPAARLPDPVTVDLDPGPSGPERGPTGPDPGAAGPSMFSLEGRAVPALYLVGWVGTVIGLGLLAVSFMAAGSGASPWLFLAGLLVVVVGLVAAAGSQAVERSRRLDLAYRGPSPVLAFIVVMGLTLVAIVVVLAPLGALGLDAASPVATTLSLVITTAMYLVVVRVLVVGPGALSWADMGLRVPAAAAVRDLVVGAALAIPVLVVTLVLAGLLSRFLEAESSPLPVATDAIGFAANLLSAAVLAPFGEELFFRGFATTAWARVAGAGQAILRGALFFAIAHVVTQVDTSFADGVQRALFSFLALLPVAVTLGWLFLSRRSLYAAIGLHAAFNAVQVIALYASGAAG